MVKNYIISLLFFFLSANTLASGECSFIFKNKNVSLQNIKNSRQKINYTFEEKGILIEADFVPIENGQFSLAHFSMKYNPEKLFPGSYFRNILGKESLDYSIKDIRVFMQNTFYAGYGPVFELYMRLPRDTNRTIDDGPLISLVHETGQLIAYPPFTNVDAELSTTLAGSFVGIKNIVKGLSIEIQGKLKNPKGRWAVTSDVN